MAEPVRIGPIEYPSLPWRVRLALWIAPELRDEIAHWASQALWERNLRRG